MAKTALCIGINYAGTEFKLRGCINDADDWAKLLNAHGFKVGVLAEQEATKRSILDGIKRIVTGLKPGDIGFIHFSGHGSWVPDSTGDEPDGRDEALCPIDLGEGGHNLILDDDLCAIFSNIPVGAHVVFVTDCCHSGTVFRMMAPGSGERTVRFLPPSHFTSSADTYMDRAYGLPMKSNAPLPGLIHFSGCKDSEYGADANINGRPCGAFSNAAIPAFSAALAAGTTYHDVFKEIRKKLPSWEFQQTPQLNAPKEMKRLKVFG